MSRRCPHCDQILPEYRLGVKLPPLKARIFDFVSRAGRDGISWDDLFALVYDGDRTPRVKSQQREKQARAALKAHIYQINTEIKDGGYRIIGHGGGRSVYRLEKSIFTDLSQTEAAK